MCDLIWKVTGLSFKSGVCCFLVEQTWLRSTWKLFFSNWRIKNYRKQLKGPLKMILPVRLKRIYIRSTVTEIMFFFGGGGARRNFFVVKNFDPASGRRGFLGWRKGERPPLNESDFFLPEDPGSSWSNYSDLTRPHPKWWFSKGIPLISGKSRLVKYYNLARIQVCPVRIRDFPGFPKPIRSGFGMGFFRLYQSYSIGRGLES